LFGRSVPDPAPVAAEPPVLEPRQQSRYVRVAVVLLLAVMASADAYGFWNTLTRLIKRDTNLVLFFVIALALGAVAAAHEVGRLARSRRSSHGGSATWMALLSLLWFSLGVIIFWLRSIDTGLSGSAQGSVASKVTTNNVSVQLGALLLVLYLMTGVLAMSHAYRYGDPRSAQLRDAHARREKLTQDIVELQARAVLAEGLLLQRQDDQKRARDHAKREHENSIRHRRMFGSQARQAMARHLGDPEATEKLSESLGDFGERQTERRAQEPPDIWNESGD
jgi:hypothetical protein